MRSIAKRTIERSLVDEMSKSYIDYSMSVIIGRALPDVRDGLKPVHRRILYAMGELGMTPDKAYKKSARIVGEVLGKYHPHGEVAVYDTMVRMAQDFSYRCPLVDGQGNYGSLDGDSPAAMRYTEARLSPLAMELLKDVDREIVDFVSNFDDSLEEPDVLPSRFPNLLVNGSAGIAVGMSTSIPPHNLGEVVSGLLALIDDPEITTDGLLKLVRGPDFPTGGIVLGGDDLVKAYKSGRGQVTVRGKVFIEDLGYGKKNLIITEIPYQTNKIALIEKIAEGAEKGKITDLSDLRDESDQEGVRIVLELKQGANPQKILKQLYKNTTLQGTFSIIMLALVNKEPQLLNLKQMLAHYLDHRKEVVTRRTEKELRLAEARRHLVDGLIKAVDVLDEVIALIRASKDRAQAHEGLVTRLGFTAEQARAILDLRLHRLTGLEITQLRDEADQLARAIASYQEVLGSQARLMEVIREELFEIRDTYVDQRRTDIRDGEDTAVLENIVPDESVIVIGTRRGYLKHVTPDTYSRNLRQGSDGYSLTDGDRAAFFVETNTQESLTLFTSCGSFYTVPAHEIPKAYWNGTGEHASKYVRIGKDQELVAALVFSDKLEGKSVTFVTEQGTVKKTDAAEYGTRRSRHGQKAINLSDGDRVLTVLITGDDDQLIIGSRSGNAIRFAADEVRATGRESMGVKGMDIGSDDRVVAADVITATSVVGDDQEELGIVVCTVAGFAKRSPVADFRIQSRAGKGLSVTPSGSKEQIAGLTVAGSDTVVAFVSPATASVKQGSELPMQGRLTQGTRVVEGFLGQEVVWVARMP